MSSRKSHILTNNEKTQHAKEFSEKKLTKTCTIIA